VKRPPRTSRKSARFLRTSALLAEPTLLCSGGVPVGVQLFTAGVIVGLLLRRPKAEPGP
jgi:hypothetical protein